MATHTPRLGSHRFDGTPFLEAYRHARKLVPETMLPGLKTAHALLHELRGLIHPGQRWTQDGNDITAITPCLGWLENDYLIEDTTECSPLFENQNTKLPKERVSESDLFGHFTIQESLHHDADSNHRIAGALVTVTARLRGNDDCTIRLLQENPRAGQRFVTLAGIVTDIPQSACFDLNLRQATQPLDLVATRGTQKGQSLRKILNRYDS